MTTHDAVRLADAKDYRITLHHSPAGAAKPLVITFGGQPSDLDDEGFGTKFFRNQGFDTIYVTHRRTTEYQGLSLDDFVAAVEGLIRGRDVVCYGSSLGGYAALYYGGAINARILAAAPLLPPWPRFGLPHYDGFTLTHKELWDVPKPKRPPVVIYDPLQDRDKIMVEEMIRPTYGDGFRELSVPYGGHTVLLLMSEAGLLKPLVLGFVERNEVIEFEIPGEGYSLWHGQKACEYYKIDKMVAREELRKSIEARPRPRYISMLLTLLVQADELDEAAELIGEMQDTCGADFKLLPACETLVRQAGLLN